jgi:hypothetical protein
MYSHIPEVDLPILLLIYLFEELFVLLALRTHFSLSLSEMQTLKGPYHEIDRPPHPTIIIPPYNYTGHTRSRDIYALALDQK